VREDRRGERRLKHAAEGQSSGDKCRRRQPQCASAPESAQRVCARARVRVCVLRVCAGAGKHTQTAALTLANCSDDPCQNLPGCAQRARAFHPGRAGQVARAASDTYHRATAAVARPFVRPPPPRTIAMEQTGTGQTNPIVGQSVKPIYTGYWYSSSVLGEP